MDDLISRQAAIDALTHKWDGMVTSVFDVINSLPSAQPERPTGEWIVSESEEVGALGIRYKTYTCPSCGWNHSLIIPRNFCPNCGCRMSNCGADMKGEKNETN